jgi:hypothetical protein
MLATVLTLFTRVYAIVADRLAQNHNQTVLRS